MCTLVTVVCPASSAVIYLQPFTSDFPRADIYEMITPDLLHQVIKGTFKDHLVTWVCKYLKRVHGERHAGIIIDDIDRRYVFQFTCGDHNADT
jgi:Plavaka transposase